MIGSGNILARELALAFSYLEQLETEVSEIYIKITTVIREFSFGNDVW